MNYFLADILSRMRLIRPLTLFLVTTQRCNARCTMCSIWKAGITQDDDMSLEAYRALFANPLFSGVRKVTLSGGEALMRPDVVELAALTDAAFPALSQLTVASNGLASEMTAKKIEAMAAQFTRRAAAGRFRLHVQVSCDGVSEVHDAIRGKDAHQRVAKTFELLGEVRRRHPFVDLSSICVIQPANLGEALEVGPYLQQRFNVPLLYTCVCRNDTYYQNTGDQDTGFDDHQARQARDCLTRLLARERAPSKRALYFELRAMLDGRPNSRRCPSLRYLANISHNGDMFPCLNAMDMPLGNVLREDPEALWFSPRHAEIAAAIRREKCPSCMFTCGMGWPEAALNALRSYLPA